MAVTVCCSPREQGKPCSLTMSIMAVNAAVMLVLLLFPALSFVREGLLTQSAGATHGALPLQNREAKVAPVRLRNQVLAIRFGSGSRFASADNEGEEITRAGLQDAPQRRHLRNVRARRLHAVSDGDCNAVAVATSFRLAVPRRMGPSNDPTRPRKPLTARPIKLFILCANRGLRKVTKVGIQVALTSPSRAAPANQHVVPFGNNHRRALKQLPQPQVLPLPFTLPSVPQVLFSPPPSPQLRIPPLPLTGPSVPPLLFTPPLPQLQIPPLPFTVPATVPPLPVPLPASPQLRGRPPSITLPREPSPLRGNTLPIVPPAPFLSVPTLPITLPPELPLPSASVLPKQPNLLPLPPLQPLPFQIPPLPCVPSSSGRSLPPP